MNGVSALSSAGREIPATLETHPYEVKWPEAIGYLCYLDLAGTEWQTRFRYRQNTAGQYSVEFIAFGNDRNGVSRPNRSSDSRTAAATSGRSIPAPER